MSLKANSPIHWKDSDYRGLEKYSSLLTSWILLAVMPPLLPGTSLKLPISLALTGSSLKLPTGQFLNGRPFNGRSSFDWQQPFLLLRDEENAGVHKMV